MAPGSKSFVVKNVPDMTGEDEYYLTDILESALDIELESAPIYHPALSKIVLVTFLENVKNTEWANRCLAMNKLKGQTMTMSPAHMNLQTIIVDRQVYSHYEFIVLKNIPKAEGNFKTFSIPDSEQVAIYFVSEEAYQSTKRKKSEAAGVDTRPFFDNFQGLIEIDGIPLIEKMTETLELLKTQLHGNDNTQIKSKGRNEVTDKSILELPLESPAKLPKRSPDKSILELPLESPAKLPKRSPKSVPRTISQPSLSTPISKAAPRTFKDQTPSKKDSKPIEHYPSPAKTFRKTKERNKETCFGSMTHLPSGCAKEDTKAKTQMAEIEIDDHEWKLIEGKLGEDHLSSVKYDEKKHILEIPGSDGAAIKRDIKDLESEISKKTMDLSDDMKHFFKKRLKDHSILKNCLQEYSDKFKVVFDISWEEVKITCLGWNFTDIDRAMDSLKGRLMHCVKNEKIGQVNEDDLRKIKKDLESEYLVNFSWSGEDADNINITIEGVWDDFEQVNDILDEIISKNKIVQKTFQFSADHSLFVEHFIHEHLDFPDVNVTFKGMRNDKYCIDYKGTNENASKFDSHLKQKRQMIKTEHINISNDFDPITSSLLTKKFCQMQSNGENTLSDGMKSFERENKCCISKDIQSETVLPRKPRADPNSQPQQKGQQRIQDTVSVQISPTLQVNIKRDGDIVKEEADVLVCTLHDTKRLDKLYVSKSFLKAIPDLQEKVNAMEFSPSCNVMVYPITSPNIKCKAIIFVQLPRYKDKSSDTLLQKSILEALCTAVNNVNAKSIAFPPLGLGKMLKYTADCVAEQFYLGIEEYQQSNKQLKDIRILSCDGSLHEKLNSEMLRFSGKKKTSRDEQNDQRLFGEPYGNTPVNKVLLKIVHNKSWEIRPTLIKWLGDWIIEVQYPLNTEYLPRGFRKWLNQRIQELAVTMEEIKDGNNELIFKLKGFKEDVNKLTKEISDSRLAYITRPMYILSDDCPKRGTMEFIKHAAAIEEKAPGYWKLQPKGKQGEDRRKVFDVDQKTKNAIKKMFLDTWESDKTGTGNDARNIPKKCKIEFIDCKRVENLDTYKKYASARKEIFQKKAREGKLCKSIAQASKKSQDSLLAPYIPSFMADKLCHEINECYLLHGTKSEVVEAIKKNGCDPSVGNVNAMFGKGVYAAECSTKCDQYTDIPDNRLASGEIHFAFLIRMLLGDIYVVDENHDQVTTRDPNNKIKRAFCKKCKKDVCTCAVEFYDSVLGEGKWIFREFIVYMAERTYPEYLITYKRIHP